MLRSSVVLYAVSAVLCADVHAAIAERVDVDVGLAPRSNTQSARGAESDAAPRVVRPVRALMIQPLTLLWNTALRAPNAAVFEAPVVLVVGWRDALAWTFELTPSITHGKWLGGEYQSRKLLSSVGLTIFEHEGGGFFATPKVFAVFAAEGEGTFQTLILKQRLSTSASQLSIGADIGYEWRFDRVIVAVVAGMSAGSGRNLRAASPDDMFTASLVSTPLSGIAGVRVAQRAVVDLNLNLLRVGVPF